jgi:hypothetical protein
MKPEARSETISITDPWGVKHTATVTWLPEPLTGLSAANDNVGRTEVAWADECPVMWQLDNATRTAKLVRKVRSFTGDYEWDRRAGRVNSHADLQPGTFVLDELEGEPLTVAAAVERGHWHGIAISNTLGLDGRAFDGFCERLSKRLGVRVRDADRTVAGGIGFGLDLAIEEDTDATCVLSDSVREEWTMARNAEIAALGGRS